MQRACHGDRARTGTLSGSLLHTEELSAGLRPARHVKATSPRVFPEGAPSTSASGLWKCWVLRGGQRNPPPMGTAAQKQLREAEGTKRNHSYQTWRRQERERKQDQVTALAWRVPQNITPWEGVGKVLG